MTRINIFLTIVGMGLGFAPLANAAGELVNSRLNSSTLGARMSATRLSLPPVRDKDKKEELEVKKKKVARKSSSVKRVTRFDSQRKRKTKRVVASQ